MTASHSARSCVGACRRIFACAWSGKAYQERICHPHFAVYLLFDRLPLTLPALFARLVLCFGFEQLHLPRAKGAFFVPFVCVTRKVQEK